MTSLAQLRDCHSCYDERSIDQKKKGTYFTQLQTCNVTRVQSATEWDKL